MATKSVKVCSGGYLHNNELSNIRLIRAYAGTKNFKTTGWNSLKSTYWIIDYLNHGTQEVKIGEKKILRTANMAMLYSNNTGYSEFEQKGYSVDESFMSFSLSGNIEKSFRSITGKIGYCCFSDPDKIIGTRLEKLCKSLFYRTPGYQMFAKSTFAEILGLFESAMFHKQNMRIISKNDMVHDNIYTETVKYIKSHIYENMTVLTLAANVKMSKSSFAHKYPNIAGETPLQTIIRLKIEKSKHLMLDHNLSVKETANHLGFSSEFHFSRVFKRIENIPPSHYRTRLMHK